MTNVNLLTIDDTANQILEFVGDIKIVCLKGNLGAGKTTLSKVLSQKLGVTDTVSSPTFSIVNEYKTNENKLIYHFDCYRLKSIEEALDFGIEEYLDSNCLCIIEWPEIIEELLPDEKVNVSIEFVSDSERKIKLEKYN